jgi:adenylate cyclase
MHVLFDGDGPIEVGCDETLLGAALRHGIAHAHACGGNARCSTCRVAVLEGGDRLAPPTPAEQALTVTRHFPRTIRLACQTRPLGGGPIRVRRLVRDENDLRLVLSQVRPESLGTVGDERSLAVLFADVREFTRFSHDRLAYDVVHVLNRYYECVGGAIAEQGGYVDKVMGDGLMALFGLESPSSDNGRQACLDAVRAALQMHQSLADFNQYLRPNFGAAFRIGIGIHYGTTIVGRIGVGDHQPLTAVGDVVNTASRLEALTKRLKVRLLVSDDVWCRVRGELPLVAEARTVQIRGRGGRLAVFSLDLGTAS